jgi:hypothetical protein
VSNTQTNILITPATDLIGSWSNTQATPHNHKRSWSHTHHVTLTTPPDETDHLITLNTRRVGRRLGLLAVAQPLAGRRYSGAGPDCCWWRGGSIFGLVCGAAAASCQPRVGLGGGGAGLSLPLSPVGCCRLYSRGIERKHISYIYHQGFILFGGRERGLTGFKFRSARDGWLVHARRFPKFLWFTKREESIREIQFFLTNNELWGVLSKFRDSPGKLCL